jgi:hypothetical protein
MLVNIFQITRRQIQENVNLPSPYREGFEYHTEDSGVIIIIIIRMGRAVTL